VCLKNKIFIFICLFIPIALNAVFANKSVKKNKGKLTLVVVGFKNSEGNVKVALHDKPDTYLSRNSNEPAFKAVQLKIKNKVAYYTFRDIPYGEYAVTLYHDVNENDDFDLNFFGLPAEPYGISNNVRGTFKAPAYEKAKFNFKSSEKVIKIKVK
jgi:uncharacterized protein (DUF2141 family)